jgi:hypothetical protein
VVCADKGYDLELLYEKISLTGTKENILKKLNDTSSQ